MPSFFGAVQVPPSRSEVRFQRLDLVQLGAGQRIIVTGYHPNRPKNCYSGVLEGGQGKEYVFGAKHRPVKVGTVTEGHPALLNNQSRSQLKAGIRKGPYDDPIVSLTVSRVLLLVEAGDLDKAKELVRQVRVLQSETETHSKSHGEF